MTRLSARQREVIALVADGYTNPHIARRLHLTVNTVKSHLDGIFERLGANGRAHAVALAFRSGELT